MADTMKRLAAGACPTGATDVFTATVKTSVLAIDVSNPTGASHSVTVKLAGVVLFSLSMPALGGVSWHGPQVLEATEKINLVASNASCAYSISGVEIT